MALLYSLAGILLLAAASEAGLVNPVPYTYTDWPGNSIPYKFTGSVVNVADQAIVKAAMTQISSDTGFCVNFTDVSRTAGYTGPFLALMETYPNVTYAACTTYNGYYPNSASSSGQATLMFGGSSVPGGCLGSTRDAMRILMNAMGVLNEWMKPTRNTYMTFPANRNNLVASSLQSLNLFADSNMFTTANSQDVTGGFDALSVTMVSPTRFAASPSAPVFTLASGLTAGTLSRLSLLDCLTLQYLYPCPTTMASYTCVDPYSAAAGAATFYPTNTLRRNLQCQTTINAATPLTVGELLISGLNYQQNAPAGTQPTSATLATSATAVPGLGVTLTTLAGNPVTSPRTLCNNGATCQYAVRFTLNAMPSASTGGVSAQQVTVNIMSGTTVLQTLTAIITLNCAPIIQSITTWVGPLPELAAEKVFTYPTQITAVPTPPTQKDTQLLNSGSAATAGTGGALAQYTVNYNTPNGIGDPTPNPVATTQSAMANKVFINCVTTGGSGRLASASVVGIVAANDPEGDLVTYYAFSGDYRTLAVTENPATSAQTAGAEMHTVTLDGVISIAGVADPLEVAAITGQGNPGIAPGDPNGGLFAASAIIDPVLAKDVFIVAVDNRGASSILQARFHLACGQTI